MILLRMQEQNKTWSEFDSENNFKKEALKEMLKEIWQVMTVQSSWT